MITYLAGWSAFKDEVFASVVRAAGGGHRLSWIGLSLRGFPESRARASAALAVAKRQPRARLARLAKYGLIWAQYNWSRRYFTRHPGRIALCWNGLTGSRRAFMDGARDAGAARLFAELAPFPGRVTLDGGGVNALNSLPRDPAFYRAWADGRADRGGEEWRQLGANLRARGSRRGDVGQGGGDLAGVGPFLFVPLQVPNDSQITLFSGWVGTIPGMLAALADAALALPPGWHLRIKEHPSARQSLAGPLQSALARAGRRIVVDNQTDTFAQVAASRGVVTINSSVGLQAFFYDKPVITLGQAFFALPGLVHCADGPDGLGALMAAPEALGFDAALRSAFMNYLDQVYYPRTHQDADGRVIVDESDLRRVLDGVGVAPHTR